MLGVYVTVPVACFRKGLAREYLETEPLPPPATCYGFLLSLVGETNRRRHVGCRVAPVLLSKPPTSVVLRTVWRCKEDNYYVDPNGKHHVVSSQKKARDAFVKWVLDQGWPKPEFSIGQGAGTNARPDYQQLLTGVELLVWLDSAGEASASPTLEARVAAALATPAGVSRFGGLSLGESTHLVDEVSPWDRVRGRHRAATGRAFLTREDKKGRLTLPVWVDHVGSAGTRYTTGDLEEVPLSAPPAADRLPVISPE
jgi:CRISPR-associated protein Cas5t